MGPPAAESSRRAGSSVPCRLDRVKSPRVRRARSAGLGRRSAQPATGPTVGRSHGPQQFPPQPAGRRGGPGYRARQEGPRRARRASRGPDQPGDRRLREGDRGPGLRRGAVEARARALLQGGATRASTTIRSAAVFEKAKRVGDEAHRDPRASLEERGVKGFIEFGPDALAGQPEGPLRRRADVLLGGGVPGASGPWPSGKLEAARKGAAEKIRDYALTVIGIDPEFEEGGGLSHRRPPERPGALDSVHHGLGLAGRGAQVPPARDRAERPQLRQSPLSRRGAPPRRREGAGRGRRARGGPARRRAVAAARWSRSSRSRRWRGKTSRPGSKPRRPRTHRKPPEQPAAVRPFSGCLHAGAISDSGARTNRREARRGWGRIGSAPGRTAPPRSRMSTSISRGPLRKVGRAADGAFDRLRGRAGAARPSPLQRIAATAFQKSGCAAKPTGSVR